MNRPDTDLSVLLGAKEELSDTLASKVSGMTKARIYIETFGCQMNVADTERAQTRLKAAGYQLTCDESKADVVLFNTCSVRARAEQKVFNRIGELRTAKRGHGPVIGILGCVAQLEGEALFDSAPSVSMVVGTRATDRLPTLIERALDGEQRLVDLAERREGERWDVSHVERHSPYVAFIPIIEGCNKFCTYCIVPYSRGREKSRPATEILEEVFRLKDAGYREIHLIGQNVNSYRPKSEAGLERFIGATPFSRLLRAVAATSIDRIKFTTSFPRDFHQDIVAAMDEHQNLCDWIHLPVQSGSDSILRGMRRGYQSADYLARIDTIRGAKRRYALTTDIIVGFPGETAGDFEATLKLVEYCQYDSAYIFKYSERPGTPAAGLPDNISSEEKTERFLILEEMLKAIQRKVLKSYLGKKVSVLIEGESAKSREDLTGHSTCNKVLNFPGATKLLGQVREVTVTDAKSNSLYGKLEPTSLT
jgi:tRNA-2-methylthio-N6-dimethylallyladenosine synthase